MTPLVHLSDTAKHWGDAFSVGGCVAMLLGWLPGITAILVAVWTLMRIFECWQNIKLNQRKLKGE